MGCDGEILLKEQYGSSSKKILYVKPPDQLNVVILKETKVSDIFGVLLKIFLPQGYPESVSKDYLAYQAWDTAQAFCSTITGTLATQEVLKGVGVGDNTASPLAATITWVTKEGCGHLGRIVFAYSHGSYLDSYSKKWRLFADTLNDAAMCIEMALPLFTNYTTFALCVSTVMKSIVGVAGGATRVALTQHHAIRGNMGDVSAKDAAQETAVNLVASITALLIISLFGNSLIMFGVMVILHIAFNYFAVRAVCLRTLNEPRFLQVIDYYHKNGVVETPCEINRSEPIVFYQLGSNLLDLKICGFQIKMGRSLAKIINQSPKAKFLKEIKIIYLDNRYIVIPDINNTIMYVFLKERASVDDILLGYYHATLLAHIMRSVTSDAQEGESNFVRLCRTLQETYGPSTEVPLELLRTVHEIAIREWIVLKKGLLRTGWDLSKHLLMCDEWRLVDESFEENQDSPVSEHSYSSPNLDEENDPFLFESHFPIQ